MYLSVSYRKNGKIICTISSHTVIVVKWTIQLTYTLLFIPLFAKLFPLKLSQYIPITCFVLFILIQVSVYIFTPHLNTSKNNVLAKAKQFLTRVLQQCAVCMCHLRARFTLSYFYPIQLHKHIQKQCTRALDEHFIYIQKLIKNIRHTSISFVSVFGVDY